MRDDPPPPITPGSSKQDAAESTAEMTGRIRSSGSIVKSLQVRPVSVTEVTPLLEGRHYLHSVPAGVRACFGVYLRDELHGAVVFTSGGRQSHLALEAAGPARTLTLARLWL